MTTLSRKPPQELPPGRCERHRNTLRPEPCAQCMRAQQLRLAAHEAAAAAAARDWQAHRTPLEVPPPDIAA